MGSVQPALFGARRRGPGASVQALGRLKTGQMNKSEAAYAAHLELRKVAGEVLEYWFEGVTFKLADACRYTPDFVLLLSDGRLEAHEVKGSRAIFQDDAKVKIKVAADKFPLSFFACFPRAKRDGGGFDVEEI